MTKSPTQQEIIENYLQFYRTKKNDYAWAFDKIIDIIQTPDCLPFIHALIQACQNNEEIAYVAAGPLEDLINRHHLAVKDALSELVRKDEKMRTAIQGVWIAKGGASRKTLDEILKKYDLRYGSL
jgi:hypothetical protein